MFRTGFPSIIRSSSLYTQYQVYVIQVSWLATSKQSTNLYDIYLMLCVQVWTPDDGPKDRAKHVEWYSINSKIVHLVGFTIETKFHINQTENGVINFNFGAKTHKEISKTEILKPFSNVMFKGCSIFKYCGRFPHQLFTRLILAQRTVPALTGLQFQLP